VSRDKAKEKNIKNRRQCATRVKIINANIEEEENRSQGSPRRFADFYSQCFVGVTSIGKKRENKNSF